MASNTALSFNLNLAQAEVSPVANAAGLVDFLPDGLGLKSGLDFWTDYNATTFNSPEGLAAIEHAGPVTPQTVTSAEFSKIHLVAGETLEIDYDFLPLDLTHDDFAFSLLQDPSGDIVPILLADSENFGPPGYQTHFAVHYTINATGSYDLMFGVSDAGDTTEPSILLIRGVSVQAPAGGYTITGNGVQLADGTVLKEDGSAVLSNGISEPSLLSGQGANLVSALDADVAAHLISQDGSGLISQDGAGIVAAGGGNIVAAGGGNIVSHDGGSLVSHDGGSVLSSASASLVDPNGASLISQDGNGLISQDGNGIVAQGGGNAIANNAVGLVSIAGGDLASASDFHVLDLDEQGLLTRTETDVLPARPTGPGMPGSEFTVAGAVSGHYDGNERVVALSSGGFAVAWVDSQIGGPVNSIGVQLVNADGSAGAAAVTIAASQLVTLGATVGIAALQGGGFAVVYDETDQAGVPPYGLTAHLYVRIYDAFGAPVGGPSDIGPPVSNVRSIAAAALSDGSFVVLQGGYSGAAGAPAVAQRVSASGATVGASISIGSDIGGISVGDAPAVVGLSNGDFAVAYTDTASGRTHGLYVQVVNADGTQDTPVLIYGDDASGVGADLPSMALLTDGNIALAWIDVHNPEGTYVQVITPAGAPVSTRTFVQLDQDLVTPAITALSDGRFLVANSIVNPAQTSTTIVDAQIFNADGTPSGGTIAGSSSGTFSAAATQLRDGTVEVVGVQNGVSVNGAGLVAQPIAFTGPSTATAFVARQGRAVDGYISGATVFADANGDGLFTPGEASATTDQLGRYSFTTPASGPLILSGGTDTSTGLAFTETLTAPAGSLTVTPLTTLVQKIVAANGGNLQLAERQVNAEFGLPATTDVTAMDPVSDTAAGFSDGSDVFVDGAILADTVALATAAGASGDRFGELALQIAGNPVSFDVTSVAAMQVLGLTGTVAADISALAQSSEALLLQTQLADAATPQALLLAGASIQHVAQGATSAAVKTGVAGQGLDAVVTAYTGVALAKAVSIYGAIPPTVVNNSDGTSFLYTYNPTSAVGETIAGYSGPNATGSQMSDIVDNDDGTSYIYAYDPSPTAKQTTQNWSATDPVSGAPAGNLLADVVNNTDGTTYVYAYNPTSSVKQTTQHWSGTDSTNGAPSGTQLADVVNNTDGTTLVYAYNLTSTVAQTTTNWSATNADGSAAGSETASVVDNTNGTAIVYAFNPTSSVTLTATYYPGYTASTGAPTGNPTGVTADYTNNESAITTYTGGSASTIYYGGPNGTGSVVLGPVAGSFNPTAPNPTAPNPTASGAQTNGSSQVLTATSAAGIAEDDPVTTISVSGQTIDPAPGNNTIQFLSGTSNDTLMPHTGATDTISGFDPSAGDQLDPRTMFSEARVDIATAAALPDYVSVAAVGGAAEITFDPSAHGGGAVVATLTDGAVLVPLSQSGNSFVV